MNLFSKIWVGALLLINLALLVAAAVIWGTKVQRLHLPIPSFMTALAFIAPLLPLLSTLVSSIVSNKFKSQTHRYVFSRLWSAVLIALDAAIIAAAGAYTSPDLRTCLIENGWKDMFRAKDAAHIRAIQDSLSCCGFRSPVDRAFPFPGSRHGADACLIAYERRQPCMPLLEHEQGWVLVTYIVVGAVSLLATLIADTLVPYLQDSEVAPFDRSRRLYLHDAENDDLDDRDGDRYRDDAGAGGAEN